MQPPHSWPYAYRSYPRVTHATGIRSTQTIAGSGVRHCIILRMPGASAALSTDLTGLWVVERPASSVFNARPPCGRAPQSGVTPQLGILATERRAGRGGQAGGWVRAASGPIQRQRRASPAAPHRSQEHHANAGDRHMACSSVAGAAGVAHARLPACPAQTKIGVVVWRWLAILSQSICRAPAPE